MADHARGKDLLLTLLERAQVEHYAGQWVLSNDDFERAERHAEALYTRSISTEALALITNDTGRDYRAEPFELAMIPYYRAFNYLALAQPEEAVVEGRKAGEMLKDTVDVLYRELDSGEKIPDKTLLETNSFLLYFSGLLYENAGLVNDAFIAYRNALTAADRERTAMGVPIPPALGEDLRRTGNALGFSAEVEELRGRFPSLFQDEDPPSGPTAERGTLVVFVETGWVPHKDQITLNLPILTTDHYGDYDRWAKAVAGRTGGYHYSETSVRYWLTLAVPTMVPEAPENSIQGRILWAGRSSPAIVVDRLDRRARLTFEATYPRILTRTIARGLVKFAASEAARHQDENLGLLVNLFGALTERADTRSWLTLPGTILMLRIDLPPGRHTLDLEFRDGSGAIVAGQTLTGIDIAAGRWTILNKRIF